MGEADNLVSAMCLVESSELHIIRCQVRERLADLQR